MRKFFTALIAGVALLCASGVTLAQTLVQVGTIPDLRVLATPGAPISSAFMDQNTVDVPMATPLLPAGWTITLSGSWPVRLEAMNMGTNVGGSHIWTLDISLSGSRYHSLLRGLRIIPLSVPSTISFDPFVYEVELLSDGNLYHPLSGALPLTTLGWEDKLLLKGTAQLQRFGNEYVLAGDGNLYAYRLPTGGGPVIPDASTVTLLATGLLPVAALWRRMKA